MADLEYGKKLQFESDMVQFKLDQARDSLKQARSLLRSNRDLDLVANAIFYAMYYSILALFQKRRLPAATQDETIVLFDREFVQGGVFDWRFSQALHRAAVLRASSARTDRRPPDRQEVDELLQLSQEFLRRAEEAVDEE